MTKRHILRRRFLATVSIVVPILVTGCIESQDEDETDPTPTPSPEPEAEPTPTPADESTPEPDSSESEGRIPDPLPDEPGPDDFVDETGGETVEIITRAGGEDEPSFVFEPPFVTVDAGTEIEWINTDGVFHTVTSTPTLERRSGGGDEFDAQIAAEGDTFTHVVEEPGRVNYYCSPHAGFMFGAIEVV